MTLAIDLWPPHAHLHTNKNRRRLDPKIFLVMQTTKLALWEGEVLLFKDTQLSMDE